MQYKILGLWGCSIIGGTISNADDHSEGEGGGKKVAKMPSKYRTKCRQEIRKLFIDTF